ncbi:MAG: C39 family peptidase [Candidatus Obscuribacterales bacterium]|nr:C39 family peptidase [Candidatus Obscuribacterales bacterium]
MINRQLILPKKVARSIIKSAKTAKLAIEIPDGSIYVDAPDLPQPNNYSCALAGASLCRLYGVGPDSMTEFMEGMKTKRSGTNAQNISRYMNKLGLDTSIEEGMSNDDLADLLDEEISTILAIQAWSDDPNDYEDPEYNENGHYVACIGYSSSAPQFAGVQATAKRAKREQYFYFMDPSILCRYGYMSWTNLDKRWHDNNGTRKKPKTCKHMGIIVRPNGHEPVHAKLAEEIL